MEGLLVRVVCFVREFLTRRQCRSESFDSLSQGKSLFLFDSVDYFRFCFGRVLVQRDTRLPCPFNQSAIWLRSVQIGRVNEQMASSAQQASSTWTHWRLKLTHGATGRRRRRRNSVRVKVAAQQQQQPGEHFFPSQIRPKVVFGEPCKVIGLYCVMLRLIAHYSPETTLRYSTSEQCCGCWIGLHPSGSHVSSADHVVASTRQQRRCFIGT